MTLLVDDEYIALVCRDYLQAVAMRNKAEELATEYAEALREVAGPHSTYDVTPGGYRVVVCDGGGVVVRRLGVLDD